MKTVIERNGRIRAHHGTRLMEHTLLIVDDEPALRLLLNEFLKKEFNIITLNDGASCLQFVERSIPEVIILDLNMPDMNGLEVIKKLRSDRLFDRIALIVLSGAENSVDRINCLEAGADDFVIKPFNPRELSARINAILRRINH